MRLGKSIAYRLPDSLKDRDGKISKNIGICYKHFSPNCSTKKQSGGSDVQMLPRNRRRLKRDVTNSRGDEDEDEDQDTRTRTRMRGRGPGREDEDQYARTRTRMRG